jgi:tryptophan synthase, alpha chain (EC 4.2.1.20)
MSRIRTCCEAARNAGRKLLIPYITAGDPHPDHSVALMHALVRGGADLIELGVPFSDPMADGPVIQRACERALAQGTSLRRVLQMVTEFRRSDSQTPVVLMGYLNPVERMGMQVFAEGARSAGVDGVLLVDLAVEEADEAAPILRAAGLDLIFLVSPTTSEPRLQAISQRASGYLYYVSFKGVTGANRLDPVEVGKRVQAVRRHSDLPVAVGFGVRDAASAAAVGAVSDGVVVGSVLMSEIERLGADVEATAQALTDRLAAMRVALDGVGSTP